MKKKGSQEEYIKKIGNIRANKKNKKEGES